MKKVNIPVILFRKTLLVVLTSLLFSADAFAQTPTLYDEVIPSLEVKKVEIKQRGNLKHTHIVGRYLDGGLLLQCSNERTLHRAPARRKFFKVLWKENGKDSVGEATQLPLQDWAEDGFLEMAQLERNIVYFTRQEETGGKYYLYAYDIESDEAQQAVLPGWDASDQICNPVFFRLRVSGQPVLLFAAQPARSKSYDIFYAELSNNGFSRPRRLPEGLNSPYDETCPFVAPDGTLYFSSNRPPDEEGAPADARNHTSTDLWQATTDDLNGLWKDAAVNPLAPPLSAMSGEYALMPVQSGLRAGFFISDRQEGRLELYRYWSTRPDTALKPQYYALIIGVDDYQSLGKLSCPVREARVLDSVLSHQYCFQVERLENPSASQILDKLSKYSQLQANHHLLIAYMGHGLRFVDNTLDTFCALTGVDSRIGELSTCITPTAFYDVLREIKKPQHILFLIDACFGGLFQAKVLRGEFDNVSRSVIASTVAKPVTDGGPFQRCLIKTLCDGKADGTDMLESSLLQSIKEGMKSSKTKPVQFDLPESKNGEFRFQRCKW